MGSANLNDRSQLGDHDSEIAILVEDPTPLPSTLNGRPWRASKFAATLRRQLFRKHLGLIPAQDMTRPNANFAPVGSGGENVYDFGSEEDQLVVDPLSDGFQRLWNSRARINTEVFGKVFHPVPHDDVRTWKDYDAFYSHFFKGADTQATAGGAKSAETEIGIETGTEEGGERGLKPKPKPSKYKWGHAVAENFAPGPEGGMYFFS